MTISFIFGLSVFITSTYLAARLSYQLAFHLASKDGKGFSAWVHETLAFFGLANQPWSRGADEDHTSDLEETKSEEKPAVVKTEDGSGDEWAAVDHAPETQEDQKHALSGPPQEGPQPEGPVILG